MVQVQVHTNITTNLPKRPLSDANIAPKVEMILSETAIGKLGETYGGGTHNANIL